MKIQPTFAGHTINIIPSSRPTNLEKNISNRLNIKPTPTEVKKFENGETYVNIKQDVRNNDVYIMPALGTAVNDNLMETYLKADAARRMGAHRIIAILPNFPYGRQERKTEPGEPISARLNMALLHASGVDEVITTDLHAPALQGFAREITMTELTSVDKMVKYFKEKKLNKKELVVVSPDLGGVKRADKFAQQMGCDKAVIYKNRLAHNQAKAEQLLGDVKGKDCILYDDMIDTAGTITEAAKMLDDNGARNIYICAAHGLFNGSAIEKLKKVPSIKEIVVTNSENKPLYEKIKQVDISDDIANKMLDISA
ncbi:ribose-phosphate pyrophosphokinase [bacterium]|nr:ribose-phosphate pyrophosphokinase [bacterium]